MSSTKTCPICQIERDLESFSLTPDVTEHAICDFCVELGPKAPPPTPKKRGRKPKEAPQEPTPLPTPQPAQETPQKAPERPVERSPEIQAEADAAFAMPYVAPKFDQQAAATDPVRELAARELARRRLLPFIQRFRPKYLPGWVHKDICRRLERFVEAVERHEEPRLLLMMPPRGGKSEIGSRHFPPWVLGKHPDWEIIAASHTGSLSLSFSRYIRDLLRDPAYASVFPDAVLDPSSQSVENWNLTNGGGYLAAGVGTGITGRGCLAPYTLVDTNRGKMRIIDLKVGDSVYGYDHEHKEVVTTRVRAVQVTERSKQLLDFGKIRLTTDHRIYNAPRGFYTRAGESPSLLGLRRKEGASCCDLQDVLFEGADGSDHIAQMRLLWEELHAQRCGAPKVTGSTRSGCEGVLRSSLLRHVQNQQPGGVQQGEGRVPALQEACDGNGSFEVLQQGLLQRVQGFETADGRLQWRVSDAKEACVGARQEVPALRNDKRSVRCASHQSGRDGQPDFESGAALHGVPPQISSVHGTCAADIAKLFEPFDFVVDIQTETGNFFTEGLLVHNCHILLLDDLVKDQEAADSPTIRENTWEWYISTAHSRLAPGGGVLGIMTWWSEDDWAGRIQEAMKGDGEKFEIVRYPAINEEGDEYILVDDRIVEIPPGSPVPEGARMTRPHGTALHPERYTTEALKRKKLNYKAAGMIRMWNALYQQNPTPDSGIYFTKDLFRRYAHAPSRRGRTIYQAWDFAITEGEQNDYTVCATILQDEFDNLYVLDVFRFKSDDGNAIVEHMIDQYVMWDVDYLGMEDGQIWKAIRSQFERRCQERKVYPTFEVLVPLTDKLVRANPLKGRMQLGKVYWPEDGAFPWVEPCVRELIVFPNGKHDDQVDACFVAGTPIAMADGSSKPIELVVSGDLVATPVGPRVVTHAWLSKRGADVLEAEFSNGAILRGTAAHPFATNRGWVELSDLTPSDRLHGIASQQLGESSCRGFTRKQPPTSSDLSSTERSIAATLIRLEGTFSGISRALVAFCTGTFGSFTTALSLKAAKFITKMGTISTTTFGTWSASLGRDTKSSTLRSEARLEGLTPKFGISRRSARKLLTGTSPRKEGVGTQNMEKRLGKDEPQQPLFARSVGPDLSLSDRTPHSVQKSVSGETGASATLAMTRRSVLEQKQDVFNISVDEAECYYAAGILVHNCAWAVRMTLNHSAPRDPAPKPKGPESWKTRLAREMAGAGGGHMAS